MTTRLPLFFWIVLLACSKLLQVVQVQASTLESLYTHARQIRTLEGHEAARPFYAELLRLNPKDVTAATRIARHADTLERHGRLGCSTTTTTNDDYDDDDDVEQKRAFIQQLQALHFTPTAIAELIVSSSSSSSSSSPKRTPLETAKASSAPLYLQPLRAGSLAPPLPTCALSACIQLLLLAVCLPMDVCHHYLGAELLHRMEALGVAFPDNDGWMVPYCHIMPVQVTGGDNHHNNNNSSCQTLYLATDLHPNVLSTTTIHEKEEGAVMYIGPDSLALLDHWNVNARRQQSHSHPQRTATNTARIVDFGTGSGIQALSLASSLSSSSSTTTTTTTTTTPHVTCVDINPRALRLARLNFCWNGMEEPTLILGDLTEATGRLFETPTTSTTTTTPTTTSISKPWPELLGRPTHIVANPPFLPVPIQDHEISKRYGWFSSGGASGERILQRIVELASEILTRNGTCAIVSEFMNPQSDDFPLRLEQWWRRGTTTTSTTTTTGGGPAAQAILFTNQQAISAETYAQRRADSESEVERWQKHLEQETITHISPGLLFVQKQQQQKSTATTTTTSPRLTEKDSVVVGSEEEGQLRFLFSPYLIPKTEQGSIWTPTNRYAREYTREILDSFFNQREDDCDDRV
jgi:methylase of polypeptide subunit release factors